MNKFHPKSWADISAYASNSPKPREKSDIRHEGEEKLPDPIRLQWLELVWKIARPVLEHGARGTLKTSMPVMAPRAKPGTREPYAHLEACGRTLAGIAPWLELEGLSGAEAELQEQARQSARTLLDSITRPDSPDYLNFSNGTQPLVDAAYLAQGLLRAPRVLWETQPEAVRGNILGALRATRRIRPHYNNWLLFPALIEIFFLRAGESCDLMRVDYALNQMEQWYVGDGLYADGPAYHCDYYNSFVIHPFLLDIILTLAAVQPGWERMAERAISRAQRYATLLERMISPEGTLPAVGRSLSYRCGNLHALAQLAWMRELPPNLPPGQARMAMDAVIRRSLSPAGTFDSAGWLTIGYYGHQPSLAEEYISTGSVYLCSTAFLPLGLPPQDAFWQDADRPFTCQQLHAGHPVAPDSALREIRVISG